MGGTKTGKSTFVNLISGSQFPVSHGLKSCTTEMMATKPFLVNGHPVILLDTPGFDDTNERDTDNIAEIATTLAAIYRKGRLLSGILYFHNIEDRGMRGVSVRNHRLFRHLCGEDPMKSVIIVTNMWTPSFDESIGTQREQELRTEGEFFKYSVDAGARMMRHYNNTRTATDIIQAILSSDKDREALKIQKEMVEERRRIDETSVANELKSDFDVLIERLKRDVKDAVTLLAEAAPYERKALERDIRKLKNRIKELERRKSARKPIIELMSSLLRTRLDTFQEQGGAIGNPPRTGGLDYPSGPKTDFSLRGNYELIRKEPQDQSEVEDNEPLTDETSTATRLKGDVNDLLEKLRQDLNETLRLIEDSSVHDAKSIDKNVRRIKRRIAELERRKLSKGEIASEVAILYAEFPALSSHCCSRPSLYSFIS
ncbi:hypothetical protein CPB86DRAFT_786771 [Serendipita vermifera]|nr:hypothetical protein CPB86DRAFT_786771 [Serendipita vermifera]